MQSVCQVMPQSTFHGVAMCSYRFPNMSCWCVANVFLICRGVCQLMPRLTTHGVGIFWKKKQLVPTLPSIVNKNKNKLHKNAGHRTAVVCITSDYTKRWRKQSRKERASKRAWDRVRERRSEESCVTVLRRRRRIRCIPNNHPPLPPYTSYPTSLRITQSFCVPTPSFQSDWKPERKGVSK